MWCFSFSYLHLLFFLFVLFFVPKSMDFGIGRMSLNAAFVLFPSGIAALVMQAQKSRVTGWSEHGDM